MIFAGHTKFYYSRKEKHWYPVHMEQVHVSRTQLMSAWCEIQPGRNLFYPELHAWSHSRLFVAGQYWFEKEEDAVLFALTWL